MFIFKLDDAAAIIRQQHIILAKKRVAYMKDLDEQLRSVEQKLKLELWHLEKEKTEPKKPKSAKTKLEMKIIEE